jgi:hypothetical protein
MISPYRHISSAPLMVTFQVTPLFLQVTGILRGFDPFMNVVVDETIDTTPGSVNANQNIGMVVIRGNSIVMVEALEPIH